MSPSVPYIMVGTLARDAWFMRPFRRVKMLSAEEYHVLKKLSE